MKIHGTEALQKENNKENSIENSKEISIENNIKETVRTDRAMYLKYVIALVCLIAGAVLGPQLLFAIQDSHFTKSTKSYERDSMDLSVLEVSYETVLRSRMQNFAKGLAEGRDYYAAVSEHRMNDEGVEILNNILSQEWVGIVEENAADFLTYLYEEGFDVEAFKRYVVYDKDFNNGVAFMAWYFELVSMDELRIRVLADAEDYTLYYLSVEQAPAWEQITEQNTEESTVQVQGQAQNELIWLLKTQFTSAVNWYYYYEADALREGDFGSYAELLGVEKEKFFYDTKEIEAKKLYEIQYAILSEQGGYGMQLPYEDVSLNWRVEIEEAEYDENAIKINMGITEIGNLIPEFAE